jgi:hypothetical protein
LWRSWRGCERLRAEEQAHPRQNTIARLVLPTQQAPARLPRRTDRRQLIDDYQRERDAGRDDTAALDSVLWRRITTQRETAQQAQRGQYEREVQTRALLYIPEARRRLSMAGGYRESDVWPVALDFARADLHQRQQPRLGDRSPKQIAASSRRWGP